MKPSFAILLSFSIVSAGQTSAQTSPSFDQLSQQAQQAYESNHEDEAARLYAKAVELRPNWAEGWWAIGMINYETDHYTECRDALTRMTALDATAVPGWALLGLCEFRTRQYELSFQHLKKAHMMVSVKDPDNQLLDMANYHLAMLLTREGAFEAAQEVLVRVALRVKNNPEMMFASGVTSLRMPMLPADVPEDQHDVVNMAGKAFWDLALESSDQAEADFKALVAKYPKFPNAHYFYGTFLGARHPEQSAPQFLAELQVDPDSVPARVQLALRYIIESKTDLALKYAKESVALSPKSVGAQLALGEALRAKGDDEHALAAYLAAEKLEPDSPKIRLFLTNAYRALGRVDDMRREQAEYRRLKGEQQNWP